jgi:hypothetical protein
MSQLGIFVEQNNIMVVARCLCSSRFSCLKYDAGHAVDLLEMEVDHAGVAAAVCAWKFFVC